MNKRRITFIGQGWIGRHYSDNLEELGHDVIRYSLEEPYVHNKSRINESDIVFIAVPTPTTTAGFDDSIVREALSLIEDGKTVVIKSTIALGVTEELQKIRPNLYIMHAPEFLVEATAAYNVKNPERHIVGVPEMTKEYRRRAEEVIAAMPKAPYCKVCTAREAELIKYAGNCKLFAKVIFVNLLYDLCQKAGCDWETVKDSMVADKRIGKTHMDPVHKSNNEGIAGRGAAGHCFLKDFAAFREMYEEQVGDKTGSALIRNMERKNIELILESKKDIELLREIYGDDII